jgi:hypothetical protein
MGVFILKAFTPLKKAANYNSQQHSDPTVENKNKNLKLFQEQFTRCTIKVQEAFPS